MYRIEVGIRSFGPCPTCKQNALFDYPDYTCTACDVPIPEADWPTAPDGYDAKYQAWSDEVSAEFATWSLRQLARTGVGDWGERGGHEVFQLDPSIPDRVVHSMSELEAKYEKYGIDKDTHTWKEGRAPASEYRRRNDGRLQADRD